MTRRIAILTLFLTLPVSVSAKEIDISVKGMVCGFCAQGISKKFKALPEVKDVVVSLEKKSVRLVTDGEKDISDEKIAGLITSAGYNVEKIERRK